MNRLMTTLVVALVLIAVIGWVTNSTSIYLVVPAAILFVAVFAIKAVQSYVEQQQGIDQD